MQNATQSIADLLFEPRSVTEVYADFSVLNLKTGEGQDHTDEGLHLKSLLASNVGGFQTPPWGDVASMSMDTHAFGNMNIVPWDMKLVLFLFLVNSVDAQNVAMLGTAQQAVSTARRLVVSSFLVRTDIFDCEPVCVIIASIREELTPMAGELKGSDAPTPRALVAQKGEQVETIIDCDFPMTEMTLSMPFPPLFPS